ncbi:MAG: hypothetical protein K2L07_01175 [Lachnospiraceae bacterium]|nr:hypothetical protein [Lachnospiraceae bacterium]
MLGKLFKDEFKAYSMPFGITFLAGIIFTIFMKIVCMLPYQEDIKATIQGIVFYGYYYIIMLISVAATVFVVVRFYSTMVGDRGYLTWTLPAKTSTIIWSKLLAGVLWKLIATVVTFFLLGVFVFGNYWLIWDDFAMDITLNETNVTALREIIGELLKMFRPEYLLPMFLGLLTVVVYEVMPQLLVYFCIAIGQLFGKWRIIASLGCYFLIMILMEILMIAGIAVMAIGGVSAASVGFFENMSVLGITNFILSIVFVLGILLSVLFFALTNWIFKKHLNLE